MYDEFEHFKYAYAHESVRWLSQNTNQLVISPDILNTAEIDIGLKKYIGYAPPFGTPELRTTICNHLSLDESYDSYITQGATEAINVVMRMIFQHGGELITSDPGYGPIAAFAKMAGAEVVKLPIYQEPYHLTPSQVEEAITKKTKAIVIVDPSNPIGSVYDEASLIAIAQIAKKHNLFIINDITYYDFAVQPLLITHYYPEKTFTIYSLSKCAALAGMRIGAVLAKTDLLKQLQPFWAANLGANILGQDIAQSLLNTFTEWYPSVKQITKDNCDMIVKTCDRLEGVFCPIRHSQANVFIIDITETGLDSFDVQERLLYDYQVFVRNGYYTSPRFGKNYIRVSFSNEPSDVAYFCESFQNFLENTPRL